MNKIRIPGIVNIFKVSQPDEIKLLAQDPRMDRKFKTRTCPINSVLLKRSLAVLSFEGRRFPTMTPREVVQRQTDQENLRKALNERIDEISAGIEELEPLANWVRGVGAEQQIGILTQQLLGRLFSPTFEASEDSWEAAKVLVAAPRSWNLPMVVWWLVSGKVKQAKRLLAGMVDGNLSAVNAVGIAVHNVVKGMRHMRSLYAETAIRSSLLPAEAARQCLFAPVSLYRQATEAGQIDGCSFQKNSLFVFEVGEASRQPAGQPLVFMDGTWSRCPAAQWVPAMLEGVWRRATISLETLKQEAANPSSLGPG
jgi:hypothetical protein